jgi:hypothetical protein
MDKSQEQLEILQELIFWKDCIVKNCEAKVYCGIESGSYCFPHSAEYLNIFPHFLDQEFWDWLSKKM